MKRIINHPLLLIPVYLTAVILYNACSSAREITTATPQEIKSGVDNNRWKFSADYVTPSYGNSRSLTSEYFVSTTNNKLIVALPYFGKLNSPSGALEGNPLDFESTNFDLTKEQRNAGAWVVTIKDPDREVQSMVFTFFDNGSAQLDITMTNRTSISYTGRMAPLPA
jgi:hypothetical protein